MLELAARVMARAVTAEISEHFHVAHAAAGIRIHLGEATAIESDGNGNVTGVSLQRRPPCAGGPGRGRRGRPAHVELAAEAGLAVASGDLVDEQLLTPRSAYLGDRRLRCLKVRASAGRAARVCRRDRSSEMRGGAAGSRRQTYDGLPWFWSDQATTVADRGAYHRIRSRCRVRGDAAQRSFRYLL